MEISGYHTPKRSLQKQKQNEFHLENNSPIHSVKRKKSFIPFNIFKFFHTNSKKSFKDSVSQRKNDSEKVIPEEKENCEELGKDKEKIIKNGEIKNEHFENFVNNIYLKEPHLDKNIIPKSHLKINDKNKRNYISTKTLFNSQNRRKSAINSELGLSNFSKKKNNDNNNIKNNKDGLTINSNYKAALINKKLCKKIDNLLHKKKLSKNEKEIVLNYFNIKKDFESSPKHKRSNVNLNSHTLKRISNKSSFSKFRNKANEEKTEKEKIENEENNIILKELKSESSKISWLKTFFCCLENY